MACPLATARIPSRLSSRRSFSSYLQYTPWLRATAPSRSSSRKSAVVHPTEGSANGARDIVLDGHCEFAALFLYFVGKLVCHFTSPSALFLRVSKDPEPFEPSRASTDPRATASETSKIARNGP